MEIKEKNRSATYIVPLLNQYLDINKALLLNSYLYDINNPELNLPNITGVLLLFKWSGEQIHRQYEDRLLESEYVLKKYEINEDCYMVFVKIDLQIAKDVKLILDGKFSRISDLSKGIILKFWQQGSTSKLYNVLYRKAALRKEIEDILNVKLDDDAELGSTLNLHNETFNTIIKTVELK